MALPELQWEWTAKMSTATWDALNPGVFVHFHVERERFISSAGEFPDLGCFMTRVGSYPANALLMQEENFQTAEMRRNTSQDSFWPGSYACSDLLCSSRLGAGSFRDLWLWSSLACHLVKAANLEALSWWGACQTLWSGPHVQLQGGLLKGWKGRRNVPEIGTFIRNILISNSLSSGKTLHETFWWAWLYCFDSAVKNCTHHLLTRHIMGD